MRLMRPMRQIGLMGGMGEAGLVGAVAVGEAGGGHLFADASVFDEFVLEMVNEFAQEVVFLVDKCDENVSDRGIGAVLYLLHEKGGVSVLGADLAGLHEAWIVGRPLL